MLSLLIAAIYSFTVPYISTARTEAEGSPIKFTLQQTIQTPDKIFNLVNNKRVSFKVAPLHRNEELTKIAEVRAQDMANRHYFGHKSPEGKYFFDLIQADNYNVGYVCENLDTLISSNPNGYINDWLSAGNGHRDCMLNSATTDVGFAIAKVGTSNTNKSGVDNYIIVAIQAELL